MATRLIGLPNSVEYHNTTNFPAISAVNNRPILAFDAATDEECCWTDIAAQGLTGPLTAIITYVMASATSGTVRFEALIEAISDGDSTDVDATTSFGSTNSGGATVPGTAGYIDQISITLTNDDGIAAGDLYRLAIRRDADGTTGTDTATGDAYVLSVELRDSV
jgi:hypothetical protein